MKAAHDHRSRTTAIKKGLSGKSNTEELIRNEVMKDARKSILTTYFDKDEDGQAEFNHFITKDYYERYLPKEITVFEIC